VSKESDHTKNPASLNLWQPAPSASALAREKSRALQHTSIQH
jgi:hypothetical protein